MAKLTTPIGKLSRREGVALGKENVFRRRPYPPGVHGPKFLKQRQRVSSYGIQLREKQKAKRLYGMMERQFRRFFREASAKKGNTAENLVCMLEQRLDNVVYRLGFASTRRQARQMVSHGFFEIDGVRVNIPSYQVAIGEIIVLRMNKQEKGLTPGIRERLAKFETPRWLSVDPAALSGKVTALPEGEDLRQVFDPTLIVEFYSR